MAGKIQLPELMKGQVSEENEPPSNIVRVFLSSTFTDMSSERNILYHNAYPQLRNFCQNLGMEFQVIDMRWGVRDTAVVDHSTTSLCLLEVQACKKVSAGPFFVVFLGHRYGYQPLPTAISNEEFLILQGIASETNSDDEGLMEKWYRLDKNNIPDTRILDRITTHFKHYNDPNLVDQRDHERSEWNRISDKLVAVLRKAADVAAQRGVLTPQHSLKYSKSVTHMEVEEALVGSKGSSILAYNREISDLNDHMTDRNARKYVDMLDSEFGVDRLRQKMLAKMKKRIAQNSPAKKIHNYRISWKDLEEVDQADQVSEDVYLKTFCDKFVSDIKKAVKSSLNKKRHSENKENDDPLLEEPEEVLHHARLQYAKTLDFCGRENLINNIVGKILDERRVSPITLFGKSGSGKTALMAKIIERMRSVSSKSTIVYRFLGTSPDSSNIHKVLKSVILQISVVYRFDAPPSHLMQNFSDVADLFAKYLKKVSGALADRQGESLYLFLDSIDQLSQYDGAHRIHWLPKSLPRGVKIIISSIPGPDYPIIPIMRKHVDASDIFEVAGLTMETAGEILNKYLGLYGRRLTEQQADKILNTFQRSPYPLFLKLMLEEAKRWRSHYDVTELSRSAIANFYERLESEHGKVIVSSALSFIIAARDGVTENELLDLLSLDDEVLFEAYQYWSPPTEGSARVPSFTWTRLKHDLSNYLVKRQATGHTVLALLHRQFIEVGREKYLTPENAPRIYGILSEYFLGTYSSGMTKVLKLNMWDGEKEVDRRVASQPMKFSDTVYNVRKLRELPFSLLRASRVETLKTSVFANPEWIFAKSEAFSIKETIEDFNMYLNGTKDCEIKLIRDSILLAKPTLEFEGGVQNHLYTEMYCRLEYFSSKFPKYIGPLVTSCHALLESNKDEILLPQNGCFQSPGGPLRTTITGFKLPVSCLSFADNGVVFAAGSKEGNIIVWDCENDESLQKIESAHDSAVVHLDIQELATGFKVASCSAGGEVKIFDAENGNVCFQMNADLSQSSASFAQVKLLEDAIVFGTDTKIISWDICDKKLLFEYELDIDMTIFSCSAERKMIWVGLKNGDYFSIDIATGAQNKAECEVKSAVSDIMFTNASRLLVLWQDGTAALVNESTREIIHSTQVMTGEIADWTRSVKCGFMDCASPNEVMSISIGDDKLKVSHSLHEKDRKIRKIHRIDKSTLVVAYQNKKAMVWNIENTEKPVTCEVWEGMGADIDHVITGKRVGVTASNQVFYLKVWDLDDQDQVQLFNTLPLSRSTGALSTDGNTLAYIDNDQLVWKTSGTSEDGPEAIRKTHKNDSKAIAFIKKDVLVLQDDGEISKYVQDSDEIVLSNKINEIALAQKLTVVILSVQPDANRAILVTRGTHNHTLFAIDTNSLDTMSVTNMRSNDISGDITALAFMNAEEYDVMIATSTGRLNRIRADSDSGEVIWNKQASAKHASEITCLAVNPNYALLFSGSVGRTRRIWSVRDGSPVLLHELRFNSLLTSGVTCASFTKDSRYLITGSNERSITIWDVEKGTLVGAHYVYAPVLDLVVTASNELIFTNDLGYMGKALFRPPRMQTPSKKQQSSSCAVS